MTREITLRISSKSLWNASATEAIQNFLKRSRMTVSCSPRVGGRVVGSKGEGDGERSLGAAAAFEDEIVGAAAGSRDDEETESESESELVDDESSELSLSAGAGVRLIGSFGFDAVVDDSLEEESESDSELEEATRRLRFLVRFFRFGCLLAGAIVRALTLSTNFCKRVVQVREQKR